MSAIIEIQPKIGEGATQAPAPIKLGPSTATQVAPKVYTHLGVPVRLGSRIVEIHQVPKFSLLPKGPEARTIRSEQIKKIGSQWKKGTRDIIRGLSDEEELVYMPKLLGVQTTSDNYNDVVKNYWLDFGIEVPPSDLTELGVEIEVGFKEFPIGSGKAVPISLDGYMKYNFCQASSDVATTDVQLDNPFLFTFFIVDKARRVMDEEGKFERMKGINRLFSQLVASDDQDTRNKIQWILETEGGEDGVGINVSNFSPLQREMELEKFKNAKPTRFEELIKDPNLEVKALIRKAVEVSVLVQEGNSFFLDSKVIGSTLLDAVGYLSNPANQTDKLIIIERLKTLKQ